MLRLCVHALSGLALVLGGPTAAAAALVAALDSSRYVDTTSQRGSAESDNVRESTRRVGHSASRFTRTDAASFAQAIDNADVLLIPELELGDLAADMDAETRAVIEGFVAAGGGLVINGTQGSRAVDFLNVLFGWSLTSGPVGDATIAAGAAATAFAGGADSLPPHTRTRGLEITSLPEHAVVIYEQGLRAPVVRLSHGNGRVVYLGWDWFDAKPLGRQDAGWVAVLGAAYDDVLVCRDPSRPDADGDGIADACDSVTPVQGCVDVDGQRDLNIVPRLVVKKVGVDTVPDNEGVNLKGEFLLPVGSSFGSLDPQQRPMGLILENVDGEEIASVTLPTASYSGEGSVGWRRKRASKWLFVDETASPVNGVREARIKDRGAIAPRRVRIKLVAKRGSYPVEIGDEPVTAYVIVGDAGAGECAGTTFGLADCVYGRSGRRLTCQK